MSFKSVIVLGSHLLLARCVTKAYLLYCQMSIGYHVENRNSINKCGRFFSFIDPYRITEPSVSG